MSILKRRQHQELAIDSDFSGVQEHGMQIQKTLELGITQRDVARMQNYEIKKDNFKMSIISLWVVRLIRISEEVR